MIQVTLGNFQHGAFTPLQGRKDSATRLAPQGLNRKCIHSESMNFLKLRMNMGISSSYKLS